MAPVADASNLSGSGASLMKSEQVRFSAEGCFAYLLPETMYWVPFYKWMTCNKTLSEIYQVVPVQSLDNGWGGC